ncbi:MAG: GSCFA domain-containing protein [Saprospiraceae bacterium]
MPGFRTAIPPVHSEMKITHNDRVLCVGSCFAEHIGGRLNRLKFSTLVNPSGIVYNPVSLAESLETLLSGGLCDESGLFENLGLWHSFAHHGAFSHPNKKTVLENINRSLTEARAFLSKTSRLLVTPGTAHVFVFKKNGRIVANCHKVPGSQFERRRLSVEEVVAALTPVFKKLKHRLPALEIVTTVSPVRHLRDGLVENQRSKATLVLALLQICEELSFVHYFPAYEIVLDDLRDYRFYEADMAHPNKLAVDYVWQHFGQAFFDEKTGELCRQVERIVSAAEHRPFHRQSTEHQTFIQRQLAAIEALQAKNPGLAFEEEIQKLTAP